MFLECQPGGWCPAIQSYAFIDDSDGEEDEDDGGDEGRRGLVQIKLEF